MKFIPVLLSSLALCTAGAAQAAVALAPSGQPVLAAIRPTLRNTVPAAVVQGGGNPAFQIHAAVVTPAVPVGSPMFLLLGFPAAAPLPLGAPPLAPGLGLPGFLAMPEVAASAFVGPAGTFGTPAFPLPIPPGLGPLGLALTTQIAVILPGGIGLSGATGIVI